MKINLILTGLLVSAFGTQSPSEYSDTLSAKVLPSVEHNTFAKGEKLSFQISYGWIDAGEATLEIKNEHHVFNGRDAFHVVGLGNSTGTFNWFFKVRDRYETYVDSEGVFPWKFVRDIHEGGYETKQTYSFDQMNEKVTDHKKRQYDVPLGVQDMISSFYKARTIDFSNVRPGDVFEMEAFVDNEVWPLKVKYLRNEQKEVGDRVFDCMVFVPLVQKGRIFKKEEDMMVWVTNDKNKIPVLAEAQVLVGSISMKLTDYSGLKHKVAVVEQ